MDKLFKTPVSGKTLGQLGMDNALETMRFYLRHTGKPENPITQSDVCDLLCDMMHMCSRLPDMNFDNAVVIAQMVFDLERKSSNDCN
jgi:hypothetical protein